MITNLKLHIWYYTSLVGILSFGFLFVYLASPNRGLQMLLVISTTIVYISWGIIHHLLNHDLHAKIVVEYMLIGILGLAFVFLVL
ncbi:MAG: hypothetical protein ACD_50C00208G0008 [uncultured bacterium]|nr:MAG: hypothetical protein ACD_50C00208G0008 [uncultured bacterium]OGH13095.1 MAG: hypothetical protein A2687_00345 [Candidatus Levybacteria bacterium RIFCSPHIGHO2_01_FULL_38_26]